MSTNKYLVYLEPLEKKLLKASTQKERIDALNTLAWELRIFRHVRASKLSQEAHLLSQTGEYQEKHYQQGLAASLITLSFVNSENGLLDKASEQCNRAIDLLTFPPNSLLFANAFYTLGWISFYLGDHASAIEYIINSINAAQKLDHKESLAWALDALASFDDDLELSTKHHEDAFEIFVETGNIVGQLRVLNNWACVLHDLKSYAAALEKAFKGIELVRGIDLEREEISLSETVGEIYISMGEYEQALEYLNISKKLSQKNGHDIMYSAVLESLGKTYCAIGDLKEAERYFRKSLSIAQALSVPEEQKNCHEGLSRLYESRGEVAKAYEHFKAFHALKENILSESTIRQISILKISHQLETAKRDATIHRLENEKLQIKIVEHKRVQAVLENLATHDPLTNLYNRRYFLVLAEQERQRAIRYHHSLAVFMIDIDHFKDVNDQYGHAAGDKALVCVADIIKETLRATEIVGRFGGDEFVIVLPETSAENSLLAGQRICKEITTKPIPTDVGGIEISISVGVACVSGHEAQAHKLSLNDLLNLADKALYKAKRSGRNQVKLYQEGIKKETAFL